MYKPRGARRRRKRERKGTNVHHVLAQSLYPQYRRKEWNKVVLPKEEYFWYHKLFGYRRKKGCVGDDIISCKIMFYNIGM
jgi:hypothetical protein